MTTSLEITNQPMTGEELISFLRSSHLLPQVIREMIIERAIAPIEYTPEELQFVYQQLQSQQYPPANLQAGAIRQLKIYKFQEINWGQDIPSYFLAQKNNLDQVSFSIIQTSNAEIIQEVYFRLTEGEEKFAELAKQYSQGGESQNGGAVGQIKLSSLPQRIGEILRTSQPGKISSIVYLENEKMFIILRLDKFSPAELTQKIRQELLKELFEKWLQEQIVEYKNSGYSEIITNSIPVIPASQPQALIQETQSNTVETNPQVNLHSEIQKPQSLLSQSQKTQLAAVSFLCLLTGGLSGFYLSSQNLSLSYAALSPTGSKADSFHTAINLATKAANHTQFAQSPAEWEQIAQSWQGSISLLKSLPKNHPHYLVAVQKIKEYEGNLNYAHKYTQNRFRIAVNHATTAANLTQTASSSQDWQIVVKHWQNAIQLMTTIQPSNSNYSIAKQKTIEYQKNLNYAQVNTSISISKY
jgi:hypothetical protein